MSIFDAIFKVPKPRLSWHEQFSGKKLTCFPTYQDAKNRTNGEKLKVEHIAGNLTHQTMFQINGSHLVSMIDAYCEIEKTPLCDQKTHEEFLSTTAEHVFAPGEQVDKWDAPPPGGFSA